MSISIWDMIIPIISSCHHRASFSLLCSRQHRWVDLYILRKNNTRKSRVVQGKFWVFLLFFWVDVDVLCCLQSWAYFDYIIVYSCWMVERKLFYKTSSLLKPSSLDKYLIYKHIISQYQEFWNKLKYPKPEI